MIYAGSGTLCTKAGGTVREGKTFVSFERSMLGMCNTLLWSLKKEPAVTELGSGFPRSTVSLHLNGLFISDDVYFMMEEKQYQSTDVVFQIFPRLWARRLDIQSMGS